MRYLKQYWLLREGFTTQILGWHINTNELIAVHKDTINSHFWDFYKGRVKFTKLGSWKFYSHKPLNKDVLDTLRYQFAPPNVNIIRTY